MKNLMIRSVQEHLIGHPYTGPPCVVPIWGVLYSSYCAEDTPTGAVFLCMASISLLIVRR